MSTPHPDNDMSKDNLDDSVSQQQPRALSADYHDLPPNRDWRGSVMCCGVPQITWFGVKTHHQQSGSNPLTRKATSAKAARDAPVLFSTSCSMNGLSCGARTCKIYQRLQMLAAATRMMATASTVVLDGAQLVVGSYIRKDTFVSMLLPVQAAFRQRLLMSQVI